MFFQEEVLGLLRGHYDLGACRVLLVSNVGVLGARVQKRGLVARVLDRHVGDAELALRARCEEPAAYLLHAALETTDYYALLTACSRAALNVSSTSALAERSRSKVQR